MGGEAQNSFPDEHGHRIAQKGTDGGRPKKAVLSCSSARLPGLPSMSPPCPVVGRASKHVCKRQHISERNIAAENRALSVSSPLSTKDMRTRKLEGGSDEGEPVFHTCFQRSTDAGVD